jgi:homocysteine S-methyltransferase
VNVALRPVVPADLPILFEHQADPDSVAMAKVPPRERAAFDAHWARIMDDPTVILRTIVADGMLAGAVSSFPDDRDRMVGYWLGREFWGRGIATAAVSQFLEVVTERPLHALVATTNRASLRVLEKCGFSAGRTADETVVLVLPSRYRHSLPQLAAKRPFVTDGGLETDLSFNRGLDLPCFASFPLVDDAAGTDALRAYFADYIAIAREHGAGIVLDTPTWRANRDWGARVGYDAEQLAAVNRRAVALAVELRDQSRLDEPVVVSGVIGPRGDGYVPGELMSIDEAEGYHAEQVGVFAGTAADMVTALTLNYAEEAAGVARAAAAHGMPSVISFTVETDGRLATGQTLREAIEAVDAATGGSPAYYMVNCAHPTHFAHVFEDGGDWIDRIGGIRANASRMSHAELDESAELDAGDPGELAAGYAGLRARLPALTVLGGCCGTDHRHVAAVSALW